ncbi:uncharacterized protein LOC113759665 [Coffea eugenioides]|uniref:uncharacterized protein LOC113759665 n=1 Tax=Coffea eugenioides TaxID=49369 RepID=UPI000F605661|nr:uncharacterized protein LOC113759665 [Coffea eugenioides]
MLIAVSADANNQLFPLAFSIVESENNERWGWFMACIREFVTQQRGLCVISDHHPGIIPTMNQVGLEWIEPFAYHRFCIRHLGSNFKTKFHDKILKDLLVAAANENQVFNFQRKMETIGKINPEARKWLDDLPVEKLALAHDGGKRYGIMTTNLLEVFNSVLKGARSLPIIVLVQLTFYHVNSYFAIRRQLAVQRSVSGQSFTPFVDGKISSYGIKAGRHEIVLFNRATGSFSIKIGRSPINKRKGARVQVVKLNEKHCSCQRWQIFGFPCSHVIAVCQYCSLDYKALVQNWYSPSTYGRTWAPLFHPIPGKSYWPPEEDIVLIPRDVMKRTTKGRPKSTRLHNEMDAREGQTKGTCSLCKQKGHNKRRCCKVCNLNS